jgi:dipeptidyl aminopeptidase/acylaminoacyl peptidase
MTKKRFPIPEDLKHFRFVSDPQVSPDGKSILFVVTQSTEEGENGDYSSNIWRFSNGKIRQLTFREGRNTDPRWSPDGRTILFVSSRKTKEKSYTRLMTMPSDGGEAGSILDLEKGKVDGRIINPRWNPDGKTIFFLSDMRKKEKHESDVKVVSRIVYRLNAVGYFHNRRTHLHSIRRNGTKHTRLTSGEFDVEGYSVSDDGSKVAFIANMTDEADYSLVRDIHVMPATGGKPVKITYSKGPIEAVSWSHDGKKVAYLGHNLRRRLATNTGVWVLSSRGGPATEITRRFDRSAGNHLNSDSRVASPDPSPVWDADDTHLRFLATNGGSCHLYRVDVEGKVVEPVVEGERSVEGFSLSKRGGVLAYTSMDSLNLANVYVRDRNGERKITSFNDDVLSKLVQSAPEQFVFKASDGVDVEGWVMKPRAYRGERVPAVIEIHGGPRTAYGHCFMFEFQLLAANGFAVVFTNPRGSTAYGEKFAATIPKNYGDRDYKDIMEALDYLIKARVVDGTRLGVAGGSYGGFMTNWIVGHTDRFKAAVTERSISNWYSFFGSSDIGYFFAEEEVGGMPWENVQHYVENSPITYVRNVRTPVLIIHSEEDYRCPIEQGEQFFVALKKLRKEASLLRFPEENHELSRSGKPKHRIERLNQINNWFKKHL